MTGLVYKSTGSWYTVKTLNSKIIECRIKGKFRIKGIKSTNPVAVGDNVIFEFEEGKETGVIHKIVDRKNYIIRKSVNLSKQTHIIAANIDVAFLLVTIDNPPTFTGFIDRFLATAEAYNITTVLLFNKLDIYNDEELEKLAMLEAIYTDIGYKCIAISATKNIGIDELDLSRVKVYPNPVQEVLHLKLLPGATDIRIYNASGQLVDRFKYAGGMGMAEYDMKTYMSGLYLFVLEQNGKLGTLKVIKE